MAIDKEKNDPRLTAYALDELEGEEKQAVERLVADDPEALAEVEAIRETAAYLRRELAQEPPVALTDEQRERVLAEIDAAPPTGSPLLRFRPRLFAGIVTAAAACLCLAIFLRAFRCEQSSNARIPPGLAVEQAKMPQQNECEAPPESGTASQEGMANNAIVASGPGSVVPMESGKARALKKHASVLTERRPKHHIATQSLGLLKRFGDKSTGAHLSSGYAPAGSMAAPTATAAPAAPFEAAAPIRARKAIAKGEKAMLARNAPNSDDTGDKSDAWNREAYDRIVENPLISVRDNPLSTFSIDVDTASYANVRRFLEHGLLPPPDAVRIEELINYFPYDYPQPTGEDPFSVNVEVSQCPWTPAHRLVRIGLEGREIPANERPPSNLVFLLDVSGSMDAPNKLPLLVKSMKILVNTLTENDRVAIVVYAGASGLVLPSTTGDRKATIVAALDHLRARGSTNGAAGIRLAYRTAIENFIAGGSNRVILATDGDFNVGVTNRGELTRLIEEKAKAGVFLTVLGFGMGNYQDATLEQLADKGNGNYAYIDSEREARKVLVEQVGGTLVTIAKDVKIQVEFNPARVAAYRLVGYENRLLADRDFNDDAKDAGEIGAGHAVTAFYEIVPPEKAESAAAANVAPLKYQKPAGLTDRAASGELMTVKLRYKQPDGQKSRLIEHPVKDRGTIWREASDDFRFAASVAAFGLILRHAPCARNLTFGYVLEEAQSALGRDPGGYRREFLGLVRKARDLARSRP